MLDLNLGGLDKGHFDPLATFDFLHARAQFLLSFTSSYRPSFDRFFVSFQDLFLLI